MAVQPSDFYYFSCFSYDEKNILQEHEIVFRVCISRAYYSAILAASIDLGISTLDGHSKIISRLKRKRSDMGNTLSALRHLRETSDYDINQEVTREDVVKALRDAKKLLSYLKQVGSDPFPNS